MLMLIVQKYNKTALAWAARKGHKEVVEMLLDKPAYVDKVTHY